MIVTATGLNLLVLGGMEIAVDGREVDLSETVGYKGMMFSGVPNLAYALGYTNASWTLKCDLVAEYVCRLLNHMDEHGYAPVHAARARPVGAERSRSSTSSPATCCARSTSSPSRAAGRRGGSTRTTPATSCMLRRGALEDEGDGVLARGAALDGPDPVSWAFLVAASLPRYGG